MALKLADRVVESSTSTGTGTFTLGGAEAGYQSFSSRLSNGDTTYYTIQGKNPDGSLNGEWEVGVGTYNAGTLSRDTVLESSNADALVVFSAGSKDVFIDLPSEKVITTAGTGISISGNTITNTAPDQVVSLTGAGTTTVTGTYPSFTITSTGGSGGGDVTGPSSATDNAVTRFDGTTGKIIQNSVVTISDTGQIAGVLQEDFTPATAPSYTEGRVWYDSTEKALAFYNDSSSLAVHVGQDLIVKVINNTGSTIPNGSPVYITSTSSGQTYPNVALAKADVAATSAVIGLTNGAIANGAIGYVTSQGTIDNVNTGTFTVGQVLYLSPYSAGQLMNTIPPTGITVQVGVVAFVNSSTGHIYVKQTTPLAVPASIITGQVAVANGGTGQSSYTDGQLLIGNSTGNTLVKSTLTAGTGISITNGAGSVTITNSAPDQTVAISGTAPVSVTGTYPNFTVSMPAASSTQNGYLTSADWTTFNSKGSGSVTSVSGTGTVNGITLTGTITSSGSLTLGGTLSGIGNTQLTNSSITVNGTSIALGASGTITANTANALSAGTGLSFTSGTTFDGSAARTLNISTVPVANGGTGQTSYTDGQLLIGNSTGNTLTKSTLTAGSGISITNGGGSITIAATGGGSGTVTSITAGTGLTGGTITTSGTIALADTAVTAGSYTSANITVDAQGRITSASNGSGGGGGTSIGLVRVISTNCILP